MKNYAIILASGSGSRYGENIPKQFVEINGRTIFEYTLSSFNKAECIDEIIAVVTPGYTELAKKLIAKNGFSKVKKVIEGGETRKDSSYAGVGVVEEENAIVLIHDCARPFVSQKIINDCILSLKDHDAVGVAIPSTDTIFEVQNGVIKNIPERKNLMRAQTPQGFKLSVIKKAHELSKNEKIFTDDCGLVQKYGLCDVFIVEGSEQNIKITYPEDAFFAKKFFENNK